MTEQQPFHHPGRTPHLLQPVEAGQKLLDLIKHDAEHPVLGH